MSVSRSNSFNVALIDQTEKACTGISHTSTASATKGLKNNIHVLTPILFHVYWTLHYFPTSNGQKIHRGILPHKDTGANGSDGSYMLNNSTLVSTFISLPTTSYSLNRSFIKNTPSNQRNIINYSDPRDCLHRKLDSCYRNTPDDLESDDTTYQLRQVTVAHTRHLLWLGTIPNNENYLWNESWQTLVCLGLFLFVGICTYPWFSFSVH